MLLLAAGPACAAEAPVTPIAPRPDPAAIRVPDWGEAPPERRLLDLRIAPIGVEHDLAQLDVSLRLSEPPGELGDPLLLALAQKEGGEGGFPDTIGEMYARDADGALTLRALPAKEGDPTMVWRSERRPAGAIRVDYRVRLSRSEAGKYHGTRAHAGGFEGTGATFLVLPETAEPYRIRVGWDLAAAGEGAATASSLGAGEIRGPMARLREAAFMAGPIGRVSVDEGGAHFEGAWLGRAAFDPLEAVPWLAAVRAAARAFFHDADTARFTLLVRAVPGLGLTWAATMPHGGLRVLAGDDLSWTRATRFGLAKAMVRRWIGGDAGVRFEGPEAGWRWFTEGFAAHFARAVLLRAGRCTLDEIAEDLRDREGARSDEDRGMLYAADVDAAVRAKSGGRRSLDDLLLALLERARAGAKAGEATTPPLPAGGWREIVGAELGPEAQARYDAAIVRGEAFAPPPDAFGPCFKREKRKGDVFAWVRDPRATAAGCAPRGGGRRQ
jgi:hypothetical protein